MEARVGIEPALTELQSRADRIVLSFIFNTLGILPKVFYRSLRSLRVLLNQLVTVAFFHLMLNPRTQKSLTLETSAV